MNLWKIYNAANPGIKPEACFSWRLNTHGIIKKHKSGQVFKIMRVIGPIIRYKYLGEMQEYDCNIEKLLKYGQRIT